jgi:cobalt-zinc-cadmium efflux system outer membrane protein
MLGALLAPSSAAAQQAGQANAQDLPDQPRPQLQLAQAAIPGLPAAPPAGSSALTWDQAKAKFEAANPMLKSDQSSVDEMKAEEITAYLRPNPQFVMTADGTQFAPKDGTWQPVKGTYLIPNFSYLHERDHKRELRLQSAQEGTQITVSQHEDLTRNLLFMLRSAFVQTLEAKAVLELAKADMESYDKIIDISKAMFADGDLAQIDLDRIELLRVQYETEIQTAIVNLRTSKIALLQLLDDRTPVDQFDVVGPFDFASDLKPLTDFEQAALDARPDLRAAIQGIEQSKTNHKLGLSVEIPLRIFDRNQGEKQRTLIDIDRNQQLTDAARAQVFNDVDSAYEQVRSNVALLVPYRDQYKNQATRVRDTVTYAYQHGGASLMDFLNAQSDYRVVQLAYLQLVGAYLTAAGQMNLAVGREVIP